MTVPAMRDELKSKIKALRSGDALEVRRLSDLARTLVEVLAIIDDIHARGAYVVQTPTGKRSDRDAASMISADLRYLRKGTTRRQAQATGRKGGRPKAIREMPPEKAEPIWRNIVRWKTNREAVTHMPGWSLIAAYKAFGPSGRTKRGRPKKQKPKAT